MRGNHAFVIGVACALLLAVPVGVAKTMIHAEPGCGLLDTICDLLCDAAKLREVDVLGFILSCTSTSEGMTIELLP